MRLRDVKKRRRRLGKTRRLNKITDYNSDSSMDCYIGSLPDGFVEGATMLDFGIQDMVENTSED